MIDKDLRNKLPAWKSVFLGFLLEEWMKYDKEGIIIPKQVKNKIKSYRNKNDIVGQWIEQCCEISDNIYSIGGEMHTIRTNEIKSINHNIELPIRTINKYSNLEFWNYE